jgi:hypothetical protein
LRWVQRDCVKAQPTSRMVLAQPHAQVTTSLFTQSEREVKKWLESTGLLDGAIQPTRPSPPDGARPANPRGSRSFATGSAAGGGPGCGRPAGRQPPSSQRIADPMIEHAGTVIPEREIAMDGRPHLCQDFSHPRSEACLLGATGYNDGQEERALAGAMVLLVDDEPSIVELVALLPGG